MIMRLYIFILFLLTHNLYASDWRLVEEFDNTPTLKKSDVQSIQCKDSNCFAIIQHGGEVYESSWRIYNSTDSGNTWKLVYTAENIFEQVEPIVINANEGVSSHPDYYFVLSDDNTIIQKSTDGGKSFQKIILDPDSHYTRNIAMYDTSIGILINSNSIFTTIDGWKTFDRHSKLNTNQSYYSPNFLDSNTVAMIYGSPWANSMGKGESFVKYFLNSNSWDTLSYFGKESNVWVDIIYSFYFVNDSLGFASGRRPDTSLSDGNYYDIIYKTTDGGNNWKLILNEYHFPYKGFYNNISFADENNGITVGYWGKIAMTNDGGKTWVYEPYPNEMKDCRKMLVTWAGHTPLIGTWDAGIFRYEGDFFKFPQDTVSVKEENLYDKQEINVTYTQSKMIIKINTETVSNMKFDFYNLLGAKLFSNYYQLQKGLNVYEIDISNYNSGIYLYNISIDKISRQNGKINLIR